MFARRLLCLALLGPVVLAAPVRATAADAATTPTLVVQVRSIDGLLSDIQHVATLAGHEDEAKQLEGFVKGWIGSKGLNALDTKRPLGLYGNLDANFMESTAVLLVPVSDSKAILDLLEGFDLKAKKEEDDIYSIMVEKVPFPIFFRFANQYVYATVRDKAALEKEKLLDPKKVLAAKTNEAVSVRFRIEQVPDVFKKIITSQIELRMADLEDQKQSDETEAQHKLRVQTAKEMARQLTSLINEGSEVAFRLGVNHDANELFAELTLSAKANSELAANIATGTPTPSLFAGLHSPSSAGEVFFHGKMPESARQQFNKTIDDAVHSFLDKEKDSIKRTLAEKLYGAVSPTLKAGELDAAVDLRGPTRDEHYAAVAALKLKDGQKLEKVFRDFREHMPPSEREKIKLDAERAGSVKIHRLDIQQQFDEGFKKRFGDNPLYAAFRSDALFVAGGEDGLRLLQEALNTKPSSLPPLQIDVSLARLVPLMDHHQKADVKAIAQKAFGGTGKANDRIRVIGEGGKVAKFRIEIKGDVIKFLAPLIASREK